MQLQPTGSGLLSIVGTHGASVVVVLVVVVWLDEASNEKQYINQIYFAPNFIYYEVIMEEINVNLKLPMGIGVVVVVVDISARFFLNAVDIDDINWDIMI